MLKMIRAFIGAMMLFFAVMPTSVGAQSEDRATQCEEAWLARNWPNTTVESGSAYITYVTNGTVYEAEVDGAKSRGETVSDEALTMAYGSNESAAIYAAHAALAYHYLKQHENALTQLEFATKEAQLALRYAPASEVSKATKFFKLLQSGRFFSTKPERLDQITQ